MDKNTLLLIFILFLLSSQLLSITWDIGKATIYIAIILLILNNISPESAIIIKNMFSRVINLDSSLITGTLSVVAKFILSLFFNNKGNKIIDEVKQSISIISEEAKVISEEANKQTNKQANKEANQEANQDAVPVSLLPF